MLGYFEGDVAWRAPGRGQKRHGGLARGAVAFLDVALEAGGHYVFPGITAAARTRHDVVDGQVVPAIPAVLAGIAVSVQDIAPRQRDLLVGDLDVVSEP